MAASKPMSRKVLAFAGAAAFVLGNRSRVEILDLRDARRSYVFFSDAGTTVPHRRARPHGHARRAGARPPRFHGQDGGQLSPRISIRETRACPYQNGECDK